ncbi:peroxiredoxin [Candidatus Micrarchaeota archaeon CG1_02_55_22]|nr:MAG: peroxiredoxin [Candidatus Micrarchaeota archaeon CG1_02_55_22]
MLKKGDKAPEFKLSDANGKTHSLAELKGKTIVLYFYPKDDTPGCTIEACEFRDAEKEFTKKNAVVIGVSKDSTASHARFAQKQDLKFLLLSDPELSTIKAYGAWGKKKFMGREYEGVLRTTLAIKNGRVKQRFDGVTPKGHAAQVLKTI